MLERRPALGKGLSALIPDVPEPARQGAIEVDIDLIAPNEKQPRVRMDEAKVDRHRAVASLIEELEATDWYDQRVHATRDPELASILAHNRDDEKEHAAMTVKEQRIARPILILRPPRPAVTSGARSGLRL